MKVGLLALLTLVLGAGCADGGKRATTTTSPPAATEAADETLAGVTAKEELVAVKKAVAVGEIHTTSAGPWGTLPVESPYPTGIKPRVEIGVRAGLRANSTPNVKTLAEKGDAAAQTYLGRMYFFGQGVAKNDKEAIKWWRMAAAQNEPFAQYNLGLMHGSGQGVLEDFKEAVKWFRMAAEQGHSHSQANLGWAYANGLGVEKDIVTGYAWYNFAVANQSSGNREIIAKQMTREQVAEAQELSKEMLEKNSGLLK